MLVLLVVVVLLFFMLSFPGSAATVTQWAAMTIDRANMTVGYMSAVPFFKSNIYTNDPSFNGNSL